MQQNPESYQNKSDFSPENYRTIFSNIGNTAIRATFESIENEENPKRHISAVDLVHDHFPESITSKEQFESSFKSIPLTTEEDYQKVFDTFQQEELIASKPDPKTNSYSFDTKHRPFRETVNVYLHKTKDMIQNLSGEDGKNPATDVAIYLDKSARPVSWFVNELWNDFSDKPMPRTEHLAIDRKTWFEKFNIELSFGEYIKGSNRLAGWEDLPIHSVTTEAIAKLQSLFNQETLSFKDAERLRNNGDYRIENVIKSHEIDAVLRENGIDDTNLNNLTATEFDKFKNLGVARANQAIAILKDKNVWKAFQIAAQIRALFLPGGITEEEAKRPDLIMNRDAGMKGKNITIIDEVERTGTTREIATHFVSWAFPEAASVRFDVFYEAKKLNADTNHPQNGQMLMIPFWYPLGHDNGSGRGIITGDKSFYEKMYRNTPNNLTRAALYSSNFLGTQINYEAEPEQKSLRLREQIARLRVEYEKTHLQ